FRATRGLALTGRAGRALVQGLGHLVRRLLETFERAFEQRRVLGIAVVLDRVLRVLEGPFQLRAIALRDLVAVVVEVLLDLEREGLELVARLDRLTALLVLGLVLLRVLHHALDLGFGQPRRRRDRDVL